MHINNMLFGATITLLIIVGVMRLDPLPTDHDEPANIPRITHQQIAADVLVLLARGEKINAIKRVQALTGLGMKDAKSYVEDVQAGRQM